MIDLRSDTVTHPTPAMRTAMAEAPVGDDVICVDPTVEALQKKTAEILGKEAAIFMPSGSMTNQIAVRVHCSPGDEFLCDEGCHIFNYEQGAFAQLSGVVARTVVGEGGILQLDQLRGLIRGDNEHLTRTRLVCLENTHNRGAGRVLPYDGVVEICDWAKANGLRTHLDGARLFNAEASSGIDVKQWAQHFDTVSVCFSKGLGAPVGSALAGTREMIALARRHRKLFGGGMRQAGIIAAGALYALANHRERLKEDHENARILAAAIEATNGLTLSTSQIDSNIVYFDIAPELGTAAEVAKQLHEQGVWMLPLGATRIRAVTHLDVSREDCVRAGEILKKIADR